MTAGTTGGRPYVRTLSNAISLQSSSEEFGTVAREGGRQSVCNFIPLLSLCMMEGRRRWSQASRQRVILGTNGWQPSNSGLKQTFLLPPLDSRQPSTENNRLVRCLERVHQQHFELEEEPFSPCPPPSLIQDERNGHFISVLAPFFKMRHQLGNASATIGGDGINLVGRIFNFCFCIST